ncbi:periplasmic binding protein [Denitrovibrio acetiphilus DSM 12809]|uniref:Periplasmic binding protein n=1 Tax=Denitrovibrio acetiphilus (strain DSM 12809 / NBRC 114555 / N2460) TaxID=522772 RepID=D4H5I1_DENA2|nr:ABC transporter substrate-binding protein [Denitrovibrio acetiphilus]ADD67601.1 periplasmic binding protein [Denitrovibrio acetiphilus DSM 12809]
MRIITLLASLMMLLAVQVSAQISFTDDTGKTITLEKTPEKVIVLNSSNLELFIAAGGTPAAYAESSTMPGYIKEKVKHLPSMGRVDSPDIEKIVTMQPDLVIGLNFPYHVGIRGSLESAGVKMAIFTIQNVSDIKHHMEIFGKIAGNSDAAKLSWEKINTKLEAVEKATAGLNKKKALVLFGSTESFSMAMPDSFVGQMLELAGGINIAKDSKEKSKGGMFKGFVPVSLEYTLIQDPDIIFIITHEDLMTPSEDKSLLQHPAWQSLRAVQQGHTIKLPFATYGVNPTVRTGEAVAELSELMYGDIIK